MKAGDNALDGLVTRVQPAKKRQKLSSKAKLEASEQSEDLLQSTQKSKHASESNEHKGQLAALKEKDPEFYNYLLETDKELLEFQTGDSEDDGEEEALEVSPILRCLGIKPLIYALC